MPSFAGFVHTAAGSGNDGLTINLYARNDHSGTRVATTSTNSDGYWTIDHGTEGRYDVEVVVDSSNKYRVRYDDHFQVELGEFGQLFLRGTNDAFTTEFRSVPTAARVITIPDATDTMALLAATQTLTSKTLTSPVLNTGVSGTAISTDTSLGTSNTLLSTQGAVKSYVDTRIATEDTIAELNDTNISSPAAGHLLVYDNTASVWDNVALSGGTGLTATLGDGTLALAVDAAQTGINSILAANLIIGEDAETAIDFGTNNEIDFKINNTTELTLDASALYPTGDAGLDLGTSTLEFKDAFFDGTVTSDAFAGPLTGDVTGNVSGTAATVTAGTQAQITTLTNVVTVGELVNGSIASGFGTINNGSNTITTTGLVTAGSLTVNGTTTLNGNLILGDAAADTLVIAATIQGATPLVFEGADSGGANAHETSFAITDPTADRTITFPDATLTVNAAANISGTTLASNVVTSSLTTVGALGSGSIGTGFGVINNAAAITGTVITATTNFAGALTGNVTGNVSGTAATVTTAAQGNITSLGTLTTLTVDNVIVNGTTIGHTSDTDLLTLTSANLAVAGDIEVSGSVEVETIDFTDGDLAMTIADGGGVTFAQSATLADDATITLQDEGQVIFADDTPSADHSGTGIVVKMTALTGLGVMECVHIDSNGKLNEADADAVTTMPAIGIALEANSSGSDADVKILTQGVVVDASWSFTPGADLFVGTTDDAGAVTATAPSGSGDTVQKIGVALTSTSAFLNFNTTEVLLA